MTTEANSLQQAVRATQANADALNTLKTYRGLLLQVQTFLQRRIFDPELLVTSFDPHIAGDIEPVTMNELLQFLERKKQANGTLKKVTAQSFKSAAKKFRTRNGFREFSEEENRQFSMYCRGINNEFAAQIRLGNQSSEEGKRHIRFEEYVALCGYVLRCEVPNRLKKFRTELMIFILFCWNLCARGDTAIWIHSSHIDWEGDALKIGIAKSKRNYRTVGTYYHIYANPINPEICPVLHLAIHLACNRNIGMGSRGLFRDSRSENKGLSDLLNKATCALNLSNIGAHSIRKGAMTQSQTGTPDSVPFAAAAVRARWGTSGRDGNLHKRYIKFEAAGDQLIGRVLAGLPQQSPRFATMSPYFIDNVSHIDRELIDRVIIMVFGDVEPPGLIRALPYLLANIVYHYDWLIEKIDNSHPLWSTPITQLSSEKFQRLRACISTEENEAHIARGVPAIVRHMQKSESIERKLFEINAELTERLHNVETGQAKLTELIPLSAAASGMMVGEQQLERLRSDMRETIREALVQNRHEYRSGESLETEALTAEAWKSLWRVAEPILRSANVTRRGAVESRKRRKHDLSRCGIRTLYQRVVRVRQRRNA